MNESWRAGAPTPFLSINTVGQTIMQFGNQEQKDFFLPKILAGELHFSIGYTEPGAGTDLASLTTKAVKDGDEWVINGQKIFTSLASYADYIWLAARTDPDAPKHKGITIFAVPTTDPGYSYSKIHTMVNASTFNTFYDDVRVPDSAIIGELHGGWNLIVNQLNYERVGLAPPGMIERNYEDVPRLGPHHPRSRRRPGHRSGVGAAEPGPGPRRHRVPHPPQLEGGRARGRWRAVNPPMPAPSRSSAPSSSPTPTSCSWRSSARRRTSRCGSPAAALASRLDRGFQGSPDLDLRRRRERDPARPDRHVRPGHAPHAADVRRRTRWTSHSPTSRPPCATSPPGSWASRSHARARRDIEAGDDWFDRDLWAELAKADLLGPVPARGPRAAAGTASSSWPSSSSRWGGPWHRCPCSTPPWPWARSRSPVRHRCPAGGVAARRGIAATWSSPPPCPKGATACPPAVPATTATADRGTAGASSGTKVLVPGRAPGPAGPGSRPHGRRHVHGLPGGSRCRGRHRSSATRSVNLEPLTTLDLRRGRSSASGRRGR
jgi:hypothetical protein